MTIHRLDALVTALAAGRTVAQAAAAAGISERTAYRRLAEPETQQQIRAARAALFDRAVGRLAEGMDAAVEALVRNLEAESPSVQLRAAVALLEQATRLRKNEELERRFAELERTLAEEERRYVAA